MWGFWKILLHEHKAKGVKGTDNTLMLYKIGFNVLESLQRHRDPGVPGLQFEKWSSTSKSSFRTIVLNLWGITTRKKNIFLMVLGTPDYKLIFVAT